MIEENLGMIGKNVYKKSGCKFKSGLTINTVSGIVINPHTMRLAFTFEEDDSYVECFRCILSE